MKQHITVDQLNELSEKGKERLFVWEKQKDIIYSSVPSVPNEFRLKPLNIGQMIEFLIENLGKGIGLYGIPADGPILKSGGWRIANPQAGIILADVTVELCDALWEAVKEILEK
jgi:hypothetical protein